jgi:hypothetical protein
MLAMGFSNGLIEVVRVINLRTGAGIPWFPVVAVGISLATLRLCDQGYQPLPTVVPPPRGLWVIASILGVCLAALGLVLMDSNDFRAGRITLPGDMDTAASPLFRLMTSYTKVMSAGPVEEGAIRGLVQLGLQKMIKPLWAETIADFQFVLIHGMRLANPAELILVSVTALVNGRLTAKTQSTHCAALAHCVTNFCIASSILLFRH